MKYSNTLPDVPFDPKFISVPFDKNRYIDNTTTTLENSQKNDFHPELDLGITIDLINSEAYAKNKNATFEPVDEKLLEEDLAPKEAKRRKTHKKYVSWLKKPLYASNEPTRYQPQYVDKLNVAVDDEFDDDESERAIPRPVMVNSNLATQEFTAAASTNQESQPDAQSTAVKCSGVLAEGGTGEVMTGEDRTNCPRFAELFRRLQAHSQASLIARRSIPVNQIIPAPPASSKEDIEKLVREEVTKSLVPVVQKLEEATRSLGTNGRTGNRSQRAFKRTKDGRPICNICGMPGHIARNCPEVEAVEN